MRLEAVRPPDARYRGLRYAHLPRHGARGPVRLIPRSALGSLLDQQCPGNRRRATGPGRILQEAFDAALHKPAPPKRGHAGSNVQSRRDLLVLKPIGGQQNDAAAQHHARLRAAPA